MPSADLAFIAFLIVGLLGCLWQLHNHMHVRRARRRATRRRGYML